MKGLRELINSCSIDAECDMADDILVEYIYDVIVALKRANKKQEKRETKWEGHVPNEELYKTAIDPYR